MFYIQRFRQRKPTNLKIQITDKCHNFSSGYGILKNILPSKEREFLRKKQDDSRVLYHTRRTLTAHKVQGKPHFCNICPFANDIV